MTATLSARPAPSRTTPHGSRGRGPVGLVVRRGAEDADLRRDRLEVLFGPDFETDSPLFLAARPVLDELAGDLVGTEISILLTDERGQIVDSRAPGPELGALADPPTGVGCAGAPITDPASGRVVGVLDLTCAAGHQSSLMLPFAIRAVRDVEQRLVDAAGVQDRIVLHRFLQERRRAKGPLVLVTERTLLKNAAADRLIEPADEPALRERALKIVHEADNVLVLHRGTVTARVEPILDGRTHIGAVLHLKPQPSPAEGKRRSGAGRPTFGWDSLTGTEESITELVAQGLTNRQTAERLFLSRHTVDSHLRSIFRKLDVSSRVGLARLAAEHDTGDTAIAG